MTKERLPSSLRLHRPGSKMCNGRLREGYHVKNAWSCGLGGVMSLMIACTLCRLDGWSDLLVRGKHLWKEFLFSQLQVQQHCCHALPQASHPRDRVNVSVPRP